MMGTDDGPARFYVKARRALVAARRLLDSGDADFAASRAYYAMLYSADALLLTRGLRFQEHAASHEAFGEHVVGAGAIDRKFHEWLVDSFDRRLRADYSIDAPFTANEAQLMISRAHEFVEAAGRVLDQIE